METGRRVKKLERGFETMKAGVSNWKSGEFSDEAARRRSPENETLGVGDDGFRLGNRLGAHHEQPEKPKNSLAGIRRLRGSSN